MAKGDLARKGFLAAEWLISSTLLKLLREAE